MRPPLLLHTRKMWNRLIIFFSAVVCGTAFVVTPRAGCNVDANGLFPSPDPILLVPGKTPQNATDYKSGYVVPDKDTGILTFDVNEKITVACPGNSLSATGNLQETITCQGNDRFQIDGTSQVVTIDKVKCKSSPSDVALRKGTCGGTGTGVELGYQVEKMFPLIYVCFDENSLETFYAEERIAAELSGYQSGEDRPSFKEDDFFDFDVDHMYTYNNQLDAFTTLLGSSSEAKKYIRDTSNYSLARGHFAPRADFIFGSHNRATFHFVNVAPQWQIFNGGVWNNLEMACRDYTIKSGVDLIAYTGPIGVLSYPDVNNNPVDLYLANVETSKPSIKVPKFYFKVLVEPISNRGVAFVGINNPYVEVPYPDDYKICKDVLSQISWLNIKDTKWLYACEVGDFLQNSNANLPNLSVGGLLDE